MTQERCLIRWTEVFILETEHSNSVDPARVSEGVARAVCVALLPGLEQMRDEGLSPLAVRVSTEPDNVSMIVRDDEKYH